MNISTNSTATDANFDNQYLHSHTRVQNISSKVEKRIEDKNKNKATPGRGIRSRHDTIYSFIDFMAVKVRQKISKGFSNKLKKSKKIDNEMEIK